MKLYTFAVRGPYAFPVDMLRKNQCWPSDVLSADRIYNSQHLNSEMRNMRLTAIIPPIKGAWYKLGWEMIEPASKK